MSFCLAQHFQREILSFSAPWPFRLPLFMVNGIMGTNCGQKSAHEICKVAADSQNANSRSRIRSSLWESRRFISDTAFHNITPLKSRPWNVSQPRPSPFLPAIVVANISAETEQGPEMKWRPDYPHAFCLPGRRQLRVSCRCF